MPDDRTSGRDGAGATITRGSAFAAPRLALPKGGGALRGIGETFTPNLATGTGALSLPIPLSPGRSGSGPQLSLSYGSGDSNGPFGFGWHLGLPEITRRTDKGLPRYDDAPLITDSSDTDIFILSGAEDLVPLLTRSDDRGWHVPHAPAREGYAIQAYRPRTEGLFARIERWTRLADGDCHWRSISRENVLTIYGLDANSRIADPDDTRRAFTWLIARSYDDRGEATVYDYVAEDDRGVDLARPSERRRMRAANRYLRRIRWGNRTPQMLDPQRPSFRPCHLDAPDPAATEWMFSAVLDYGEGRYDELPPDPAGRARVRASAAAQHDWGARRDPFSSHRAGFEVRTHRLCRRVMMFHHFADELGTVDCLVRSTGFSYREQPFGSFLAHIEQCGHKREPDGLYLTRALPRLDLAYTTSPLEDGEAHDLVPQQLDAAGLADLPGGVEGGAFRWLDLDGEGISGVLAEKGGIWLYKPNLGEGRLGAMRTVPVRPSAAGMPSPAHHLMDVDGDGLVDLVDLSPRSPGYYGRDIHADWEPFRTFRSVAAIDWSDPDLRFIDLTGDGIADVLITRDAAFEWRPSLKCAGFGVARRAHVPTEEEESGPRLLVADAVETIFLADMSGDGLTDLVRVRNGEVCYWPNRGYGRFGAKVTMDRAPWFDEPDQFDPRRIRLADVDGSGCADIVYLARDGARIYLNEAGNSWSDARRIGGWPSADRTVAVDVADLLGRGTACLVWSSPLPREAGRQIRYIDLMGGRKPHLLCRVDNNMGATTRIEYASSTEFYLADKAAGTPWITRLPMPVHVVRRVESWDAVSRNRLVRHYSYHHGYYDGVEREFRGFGRVDELDTEDFTGPTGAAGREQAANWDAASSVPPALTTTWYHTGIFIDGEHISRQLAHEYFNDRPARDDTDWLDRRGRIPLIPDTVLPDGLTPFEAREACRALKGSMLRREIYARDGAAVERTPYLVEEHNFGIALVQPIGANRYASFFIHPRESITVHYERNAADPRIGHDLTLAVDAYGNVLTSASIGYARRVPAHPEQATALATLVENLFTNPVLLPDAHRVPQPAPQSTWQLTAPEIEGAIPLAFDAVAAIAARATPISYRTTPTHGRTEKRCVARTRSVFRANDLERLLPDGVMEALALPGESFKLALSGELLDLFAEKAPVEELASLLTARHAGYRDLDGDGMFWAPSGRLYYAPEPHVSPREELVVALRHFFLPHRYRDQFGHDTVVGYDDHDLAPVMTRDAAGNVTRAELDYRVLAPHRLTDANGNRTEARFDALGLLAGTVVAGKAQGPAEGDSFDDFVADLSPAEIAAYFAARDPRALAHAALGTATSRFVYDFAPLPACAAAISRETHASALAPGERSRLQLRFVYADGFGREAQTRAQAEPGPLDPADPDAGEASPRWVASGATIYNNKGKPVRKYEPFFSAGPQFGIERWGVSSIVFYDPPERVVAVLHPNKTFEKTVFDPWSQATYDSNDTVTLDPETDRDIGGYIARLPPSDYRPSWYRQRIDGALGPHEQEAARKAARATDTPTRAHFDVLGRVFLSVADNGRDAEGEERRYATRSVLDIKGARVALIDALGRTVVRDDYDLGGAKLRERSLEAGTRWMLQDAVGKPLRSWNSRGYALRMEYDELHRPLKSFVQGGAPDEHEQHFPREILFEETIYGDSARTKLSEAEQQARNLRGKVFAHFDGAGVVHTDRYDFKGNSLTSARRFARDFIAPPDWSGPVALELERFDSHSAYDALNRAIAVTAPDGSVYRPTFNDASLLERVAVNLRGATVDGERVWTRFIDFINYDAKGQRTLLCYANGARTTYAHDPTTSLLIRLETVRPRREEGKAAGIFHDPELVQDLHYTYDPVGNITRIEDRALRTVFHGGRRVDAASDCTYDPLYRLIDASGREHKRQSALSFAPPDGDFRDFPFVGAAHLHDLEALRRYVERYDYDPVGNIRCMEHAAEGGSWTRTYDYDEPSELDPDRVSNRLSRSATGSGPTTLVERYRHDAHGNIVEMPHLPMMEWDFHDQLCASSRQVAERGEREVTRYVYDGSGQRARKVTLAPDGRRRHERLYLGGFEVFRDYARSGDVRLERQTLHVMDDVRRIALVETQTVQDGRTFAQARSLQRFQLVNHLGSACVEIDHEGALISFEEYSPYGCSSFQVGRAAAEVERKRYRYSGKERDDESAFNYHASRYYAPWLARWTSCDPAGTVDGPNLYVFVKCNPETLVDPSGRNGENPSGGGWWPPKWWPWQPKPEAPPQQLPQPQPQPKPTTPYREPGKPTPDPPPAFPPPQP